jgi:aspartyl-tRNA(Asn)/glutamyl-tRNA(Gln) amidotransferase subunit C
MPLTLDDVTRLSQLARITLTVDENAATLIQLNGIFGLIDALQAVDTTGVLPLSHPLGALQEMTLRLREDVTTESVGDITARANNMVNAPQAENGLFLVPKVLE